MSEQKKVHFAENTKGKAQDGGPAKDPTEMDEERLKRLADLERKVQYRKTCDERAQRIVERLLDNPINEEFLTEAAQFLHTDHYTDVTEERAVAKMCGYPLCTKQLPKQPKQKYHISVAHSKVYDITERKNFCSNQCYKASKHFQSQISTAAVWARQREPRVCFNVLPLDANMNRGSLGKVVVTDPSASIRLELEQLEELDKKMGASSSVKPTIDNQVEVGINELVDQVSDMLLIDKTEDEDRGKDTVSHTKEETPLDQESPQELSQVVKTEITSTPPSVSTNDRTRSDFHQSTAPSRTVDPRSNDPMVPVSRPAFVSHGEDEASELASTINRKAKLLTDLLDQRDQLQDIKNHRQNLPKPDEAKSEEEPLKQTPVEKQPSVESSDFTNVAAGIKVSKNSVIDNIRRVASQQGALDQARSKKKHKKPKTNLSPLVPIHKALLEWRTLDTSAYLRQARKSEESDQTDFEKKYSLLGRRVEAMDMSGVVGEECLDNEAAGTRPLPDLKQLQQDTEELNMKVREFYKGNMRYPVVIPDDELAPELRVVERQPTQQVDETEREPVMPHVDAHSQMAIRRKIVFDQLDRVMPDLLRPMRLLVQDVAGDLRRLVYTFSFTSTNIILKSAEWTLMGYVLLRLLALKIPIVEEAFSKQATTSIFTTMLGGLGITETMIRDVIKGMTSPGFDVLPPK